MWNSTMYEFYFTMKSAKILTEGQLVKTMSDAKTSGKQIQEKVGWEKKYNLQVILIFVLSNFDIIVPI